MIPEWLVSFLHGPILCWVGTRDAQLRPSVTWAFGVRVSAAADEMTVLVPEVEAVSTKRNLEHNRLVAFTAVDPVTHEAYQFKGASSELRPSTEEERAIQEIHRSKASSYYTSHYPHVPRELLTGYTVHPSTALTFRVEQAFVQTPGPKAGQPLDLSAGAG